MLKKDSSVRCILDKSVVSGSISGIVMKPNGKFSVNIFADCLVLSSLKTVLCNAMSGLTILFIGDSLFLSITAD
jgi:hypothetical protein